MAGNTDKSGVESKPEKEITFTCRFCGASRPFADMVVIRHYYPQITACSACARRNLPATRVEDTPAAGTEN
jgi:hypothetical protein